MGVTVDVGRLAREPAGTRPCALGGREFHGANPIPPDHGGTAGGAGGSAESDDVSFFAIPSFFNRAEKSPASSEFSLAGGDTEVGMGSCGFFVSCVFNFIFKFTFDFFQNSLFFLF